MQKVFNSNSQEKKLHNHWLGISAMEWDIFISHAGEDKERFVEPLAKQLRKNGFKVWYDKFCLQIGDSVRREIEKGLKSSKYGLVVLSHNFFKKEWPQRELDSLLSLTVDDNTRILPIWLDITHDEVCQYSPLLADRFALTSDYGIENIIEKLKERIKIERFISDNEFTKKIKIFSLDDKYSRKFLAQRSLFNLHKLACFHNEYNLTKCPFDFTEDFEAAEGFYDKLCESLITKFELSYDIYLDFEGTLKNSDIEHIKSMIKKWVAGNLGPNASYELFFHLDDYLDLDCMYILFDLPNFLITGEQRRHLEGLIIDYGSRNTDDEFDSKLAQAHVFEKYYSGNS